MRGFFSLSLNEPATKRKEAKESRKDKFILKYQIDVFGKGFSPVHLHKIHIKANSLIPIRTWKNKLYYRKYIYFYLF